MIDTGASLARKLRGPATPGDPPEAVKQAIAKSAAGDKSAEDKSAGDPAKVVVGAYINDIQQLDFKANNYAVDLYVWFRWKGADIDPSKTMEFMNRYASDDNLREELYDKPSEMPDGSLYAIIRYQGKFSTNFALESYPFDKQFLTVVMEDSVSGAGKQVYVPDGAPGVSLDPQITLPGFRVGKPTMAVQAIRAGAHDVLLKPARPEVLLARVAELVAADVAFVGRREELRTLRNKLSAREREVLLLLAEGLPHKDVGERLGISFRTVEVHRSHIIQKTGLATTLAMAEFVRAALAAKLRL